MVTTFLIIALIAFALTIITKVLSYIFDIMDDFFPFTHGWYTAHEICEVISEFLFAGGILLLVITAFMHLIGG